MIALIDGDIIAYHACPERHKKTESGQYLVTENDINPVFTEHENIVYFEKAWENFVQRTNKIKEVCFSDEHKMAVKSPINFRDEIYPQYKANRRGGSTNIFVPMLRKRAVEEGLAVESTGMEADDYLRIWAEEYRAQNVPFVICSIDKDLKCIHGKHYNMKSEVFSDISLEFSVRFFYEQLLKGDPTDNIKGIPKVGEVKAKKMLADLNSEDEFQVAVIMAYADYFGATWKDELILNGRLLYLLKHANDIFTIDGWFIPEEAEDLLKKVDNTIDNTMVIKSMDEFTKEQEATESKPQEAQTSTQVGPPAASLGVDMAGVSAPKKKFAFKVPPS